MRVLVLDDDELMLGTIRNAVHSGIQVNGFTGIGEAENFLEKNAVDVVILDLNLPQTSGEQLLRQWKTKFPEPEYVCCSGDRNISRAVTCLREGASDFLVKPFSTEELGIFLNRAFEKKRLRFNDEKLRPLLSPRPVEFVGNSPAILEFQSKIARLKRHTHLNVLVLGESGTGKEMAARLLHQQEDQPDRPFIVANMPAIPASLMESELFGVEKGAFTDAKVSRPGKFELADGGDIFLDEIGDLGAETQPKILRALQERQIERVGSSRTRTVSFRAISATNRSIPELLARSKFREDLLYRLADVVLQLPALRNRREDIPLLTRHFLKKYSPGSDRVLSTRAMSTLCDYDWPGNIRQLESTIKRAIIFSEGLEIDRVEIEDPNSWQLSSASGETLGVGEGLSMQRARYERSQIQSALLRNNGNRKAAMAELRLPRATFYRKLQQLGLATAPEP